MGVFKKNGNWYIDFYDGDGRRHRKKIGPQKTLALQALKDAQVRIAKGEYLGVYEEKRIPFRDFVRGTYLPHARITLSPNTFERTRGIVEKHLIPQFNCYLSKVSRKSIEDYKQKRAAEVRPSTVNKEYSTLRHMLKCAVDWGFLAHNPCKGVKELKEPPGRIRYLSREEMERLLAACEAKCLATSPDNSTNSVSDPLKGYLKPIVQIAIHSGMRRSEIVGLRWSHVDFTDGRITLPVTKNNDRRTIYMNNTLRKVLKTLPHHLHSDRVFPAINPNMVTVAFGRACRRAGVRDFRFHDLRHTFASYLTMAGANLRTVQTLLGHKDLRMTMRYSHLSPEHLRDAVHTLEESLNMNPNGHSVGTEEEQGASHTG